MSDTTEKGQRILSGRRHRPAVVGLVSFVFGVLMVAQILSNVGGDITVFIGFGEESVAINSYAESLLVQEPFLRGAQGHDGKFFFLQSLDPLYIDPGPVPELLEHPLYRAQRMLYPMLAGAIGLTPPEALPWTMVGVNLFAIALGSWGTARLAVRYGASAWWGLAFTLNLGLLNELFISGAGVVAFTAAVWAVVFLEDDREGLAGLWLTASVLAREVMLLFVFGVVLLRWRQHGRLPKALVISPLAAPGVWALYLRLRLETGSAISDVDAIGVPFAGLIGAIPSWKESIPDLTIGVFIILLCVVLAIRVVRSPSYLGWGCAGFIVLAILLTRRVWTHSFDITRAMAPVLTAFVLVSFTSGVTDPAGSPVTGVAD